MLSRPRDFANLQRSGTARSHPLLLARMVRTDLEVTRFGLATGKALGGAVTRNRVRRRIRETLRSLGPALGPGWDVLIVARPGIAEASYEELHRAVVGVLERGGVVGEGGRRGGNEKGRQ